MKIKKYTIENEETLWGNDYGRDDAKKIIETTNIKENEILIISFSPAIEDVVISYVEGFFNTFSKKFSKEFCANNIKIDSNIFAIYEPFSKYVSSKKFTEKYKND